MTEPRKGALPASADMPVWSIVRDRDGASLTLSGRWIGRETALPRFTAQDLMANASRETARTPAPGGRGDIAPSSPAIQRLACDLSGVSAWDTGLIAFLWDVRQACTEAGIRFDSEPLPSPVQRLLGLLPENARPAQGASRREGRPAFLERIGGGFIAMLAETGAIAALARQTMQASLRILSRRSGMRRSDLLNDFASAGPSALLIVGVVNFLIGAILAFVGAVQLQKFAAGIYVASLVGIASVREMAAVMTAIIMAGRTGGAYAARISTMQGNEEIDALRVFGIPISSYLVLPAVLSLVITMPLLYLYGCLIGMFGGYVVAISMLDITSLGYFHQTVIAFGPGQFVFGLVKSIVFGAFIGLTSCRIGMKAGRSAADVGIAATRAVVIGIVGVIALDAVFAVIANSVGI